MRGHKLKASDVKLKSQYKSQRNLKVQLDPPFTFFHLNFVPIIYENVYKLSITERVLLKFKTHFPVLWILIFLFGPTAVKSATVSDELEVTRRNLKGHESLYNDGWFVITASKKAIETGRQDSISASQALNLALSEASGAKKDFSQKISKLRETTQKDAEDFSKSGNDRTKDLFSKTASLRQQQWKFTQETYSNAYSSFTLGYLELGKRTSEDWKKLKKANGDFVNRTKHIHDDHEMKMIMGDLYQEAEKKTDEAVWTTSFAKAGQEFNKSYDESGEKGNSLLGLGSVLWGHIKAVYYGFIKPGTASLGQGVVAAADGTQKGGTYLIGGLIGAIKISGDMVYTTGLNIYYTTKIGYHVFAPTIESGLLGSLALVSTAALPVIYAGGESLGALNQVAVTTATPIMSTGPFVLATTAESAKYSAIMAYDFAKGTGTAFVHETHAAVVVGYNVLTQVPAQILLGAANSAVFLAYDGPHLALIAARGDIDGVPVNQIPVGTVMDTKALENKGIRFEKLTDDPAVVQKALEATPKDFSNQEAAKNLEEQK